MSDISPEDRERLAKGRFKEWFDENFDARFGTDFDTRLNDVAKAAAAGIRPDGTAGTPQQQQQHHGGSSQQQERPRRRSLIEECFSNTFGW